MTMISNDRFATGVAAPTAGAPGNLGDNLGDQPLETQGIVGPVAVMKMGPSQGVEYEQAAAVGDNWHLHQGSFPEMSP